MIYNPQRLGKKNNAILRLEFELTTTSPSTSVTRWVAFVYVGVGAIQKTPLSFWRETRTKDLRARFPMRPEEDEGRKVPESAEQERRQPREVDRKKQSTGENSQQKSGEVDC